MVDSTRTKAALLRWKEKGTKVLKKAPDGWRVNRRATTAPVGYVWFTNGKSLFSGKRKSVLVKDNL